MKVVRFQSAILVCSQTIIEEMAIREKVIPFDSIGHSFGFVSCDSKLLDQLRRDGIGVSARVLDKYYFAFRSIAERQSIAVDFFGYIASEYEQNIDVDRNLANIEYLSERIDFELDGIKGQTIVDFGCGTGLSTLNKRFARAILIGFDLSPTMREISHSRGIASTWGLDELVNAPPGSVDAIFASYVLHLLPTSETLSRLWAALRLGGVFIGNCHKGEGKKFAEAFFDSLEAVYVDCPNSPSAIHGPYICFRKL